MHEEKGESPDCETCLPPLMPENNDALKVWNLCQDQYIMAPMGGPVAIKLSEIETAIRLVGPEDPGRTLGLVVQLGREIIGDMSEVARAEREAKK
jgi:hypothetical protein